MKTKKPRRLPKITLEVPDADTVEAFEAQARKVWRQAHPEKDKKRGKPNEIMKIVFTTLRDLRENGKVKDKDTQGKRIVLVKKVIGEAGISDDSIKKYVKMERLIRDSFKRPLTEQEDEWLEKYCVYNKAGKEVREATKDFVKEMKRIGTVKFRREDPDLISEGILFDRNECNPEIILRLNKAINKFLNGFRWFFSEGIGIVDVDEIPPKEYILKNYLSHFGLNLVDRKSRSAKSRRRSASAHATQ